VLELRDEIWVGAALARTCGCPRETATFVTQNAVRILGGNGYTREYPVERWHRDATIFTIFEGASEIQKLIIGRQITGLPIR